MISDSVHEQQIDMTKAKIYWRQIFSGYKIEKPMALPVDREFPSNGIYTGHGYTVEINFTNQTVQQLVDYASHFNVTLYQVCLTIYYVFLFKLTGGQQDLIVGIVQANRYRPELRRMIGMFVNTLPMRIHVNPHDTFDQLLHKVSTILFEAQPYSNLPYQYIIEQIPMKRMHERNLIQTMFTLDESLTTLIQLDHGSVIEPCSIHCLNDNVVKIGDPINAVAMFDMTMSMEYKPQVHSFRAELTASSDLFDSATVVNMARRFQHIVEKLFSSIPETKQSIYDLFLTLPEEIEEDFLYLQSDSITTTHLIGRASFSQMRIWLDEQINCNSKMGINNMTFFYQVTKGTLSIERLRHALRRVVLKHSALRTSLFFDSTRDCLLQRIIETKDDNEELFAFIERTGNVFNFDLSSGHVFSVHIFRQENGSKNMLQTGDFVVFNFHQSVFDIASLNIFCRDLSMAYESETALPYDDNEFRYIDCKMNNVFLLCLLF
jgi:hypothetical protein